MADLATRLKKRGWTDAEVKKALSIMYSKGARESIHAPRMNRIMYWAALILAIIGNFMVCVALIPVLLVISDITLVAVIFLVGISFGALFTILIKDIEFVDPRHHVIAGIFLPALAVIIMFVTIRLTNKIVAKQTSTIFLQHNNIMVPIVYVIAFMLPYLISIFYMYRR
ncbi:hypothetical protein KY335_05775 [Candidatus Woesearchaeota archaeon]|nr:hypothetical protein [Candidatus Woesearchaeota archaeon]